MRMRSTQPLELGYRGSRLPRTRRDAFASAILVASLVGILTAWAPWHSLAHGAIEVRGIERDEGRVLVAALGVAALLASLRLLSGRPILARPIVAATTVAAVALGKYLYDLADLAASLPELLMTVVGATLRPGIYVASAATVTALFMALCSLRR